MLEGHNIAVVDLEIEKSADDVPTGWNNKVLLGISVGCWYFYEDDKLHWFDKYTVEETMLLWVDRQTLLVSYNGKSFDFSLMRGLLRQEAEVLKISDHDADIFRSGVLIELCDRFKNLCAISYDVLYEVWRRDPESKFVAGLNSLDAVAQANGLGKKSLDGAQAPRLWAQGRYGDVLNYCSSDVDKTRRLFEKVCLGQPILRGNGTAITLPPPAGLETLKLL